MNSNHDWKQPFSLKNDKDEHDLPNLKPYNRVLSFSYQSYYDHFIVGLFALELPTDTSVSTFVLESNWLTYIRQGENDCTGRSY